MNQRSINTGTVAENLMEIHVLPPTLLLLFHYFFFTGHSKPLMWPTLGMLSQGPFGTNLGNWQGLDSYLIAIHDSTAPRREGSIWPSWGWHMDSLVDWPELAAILTAVPTRQY